MPVSLNARRKFKDTPVGSIPVEWGCAQLGECVKTITPGFSAVCVDYPAGPNERGVLKVGAVKDGRFFPFENKQVCERDMVRLKTPVRKDTVIINRSNTEDLVGMAGYVDSDRPNLFLPDTLWELMPDESRLNAAFLALTLTTPSSRGRLVSLSAGTSASMKKLSTGRLKTLPLPLPPLPEQRAIADLLGAWDEAIRLHEDRLDALTERKRGLMQRLLTGRTRLPGFAGKWTSVRIGSLLKAEDRYVDFDDSETYDLVSIRRRAGGVYFRESLSGGEIKTKVLKRIKAGDLLISRMQVVHGALAVVPAELDGMCASDSYEALVPLDAGQLDMGFMNCLSQSPDMWYIALRCSHGVHIEKMTFVLSDFLHEKVTIPGDIAEQRAIAAVLTACDEEIALTRTATDALREQKRGLLQKLMTGRLRVPM